MNTVHNTVSAHSCTSFHTSCLFPVSLQTNLDHLDTVGWYRALAGDDGNGFAAWVGYLELPCFRSRVDQSNLPGDDLAVGKNIAKVHLRLHLQSCPNRIPAEPSKVLLTVSSKCTTVARIEDNTAQWQQQKG